MSKFPLEILFIIKKTTKTSFSFAERSYFFSASFFRILLRISDGSSPITLSAFYSDEVTQRWELVIAPFPALHRRINLEFKAKQIRNKLNPTSKQPPRVIMGIPAGAPARDV
ncbi:hypothetical protein KFK09_024968 [Dendrobium nobile]|uniref:Uncharacterized protein n=1 Tax=Dendrobium nobile TaxID=94219 RepID=A0A8T3AKQ7_DENNO|nr:hypothetical protein KFK09_024968 [Dendrobium nobile]